jgi:hypothetical protein
LHGQLRRRALRAMDSGPVASQRSPSPPPLAKRGPRECCRHARRSCRAVGQPGRCLEPVRPRSVLEGAGGVAFHSRGNRTPTHQCSPGGKEVETHVPARVALETNELKAYFGPMAFRPTLRRDIAHTPAHWIARVQTQVAWRGRYSRVTDQAKRDWHRLLTYNEDDCRGL